MLNKTKGNMYEFISHTWNVIKGECSHNCSYCYMKRWGKLNPVRFDEKELKTDLGKDNFIFVGSSNDMFAEEIELNHDWTDRVILKCLEHDNKYLLQTKNPEGYFYHKDLLNNDRFVLGCTIESNREYPEIYGNSPSIRDRVDFMSLIKNKKFITIEPILDFDLEEFVGMLKRIKPDWINIGADSGGNNLPEPSKEKIEELIRELSFSKIDIKKNMKRIS